MQFRCLTAYLSFCGSFSLCLIIVFFPRLWDVWFHPFLIRQQSLRNRDYTNDVRLRGRRGYSPDEKSSFEILNPRRRVWFV